MPRSRSGALYAARMAPRVLVVEDEEEPPSEDQVEQFRQFLDSVNPDDF